MRIIPRYLRGAILKGTGVALAVLVGLFAFFTLLEDLDSEGGLAYAVQATLLALPTIIYELVPMCALIGTLLALGSLAQNRELVVLRACGLSRQRMGWLVARTCAIVIAAGMGFGEILAPPALSRLHLLEEEFSPTVAGPGEEATWIHEAETFVKIRRAPDPRRLEGVSIYQFDASGMLSSVRHAARADYTRSGWKLFEIDRTRFVGGIAEVDRVPEQAWDFSLRPAVVSMVAIAPERLSLLGLGSYIVEMSETLQSADRYVQAFWRRLAYPFAALAMVMLALPMALAPQPRASSARRVVIGAGVGLGFYLGNQLCGHIGTVYGMHPVVAALLPTGLIAGGAIAFNLRAG